jgi:hypothetical protein
VRTIELFAVIGLAVALMGVLAMAQTQQTFTAPRDANDIEIVSSTKCTITDASWTQDGKPIGPITQLKDKSFEKSLDIGFRDRFGVFRIDGQPVAGISVPPNANDIEIALDCVVTLYWTKDGQRQGDPILTNARIKLIRVDNKTATVSVTPVPTLTEWGLIALAVLLAGGMGYMIYRRRPALRPAAP